MYIKSSRSEYGEEEEGEEEERRYLVEEGRYSREYRREYAAPREFAEPRYGDHHRRDSLGSDRWVNICFLLLLFYFKRVLPYQKYFCRIRKLLLSWPGLQFSCSLTCDP